MTPRKLSVAFGFAPYGGNGNTASEIPDIRNWLIPTVTKAKQDERISDIIYRDICDTPVTMVRNELVGWARENGADVLVMVDSDNSPDIMLGLDPLAKPFFETSFDFLYNHFEKGPVVIGAPYCGPPNQPDGSGTENVYVFLWRNINSVTPTDKMALKMFEREEAAMRVGIEPVAALPTGVIMFDLRAFDLIPHPYFEYEYKGDGEACPTCGCKTKGPQREKCSTEDVVTTRNISLNGCLKLGYNPIHCNWDAWAGHWKPRCVGKPVILTADTVGAALKRAVEHGLQSNKRVMSVTKGNLPDFGTVDLTKKSEPAPQKEEPIPAFREAQNTCDEDIGILKSIVRNEGFDTNVLDRKMIIVELGSWVGHSAKAMAEVLEGFTEYEIHCVDHWGGGNAIQRKVAKEHNVYEEFQRNMGDRIGRTVFPHTGDTVEVGRAWTGPEIDVLFIDAGHTYEQCLADIKTWMPHVRDGGIICGHDYSTAFSGVKRAVHEVFGWDNVGVAGTVWIVRRMKINAIDTTAEGKSTSARAGSSKKAHARSRQTIRRGAKSGGNDRNGHGVPAVCAPRSRRKDGR